ncbi:MAG: YmdB family metallophosphoesterase [Streptosporangiaceae bacterium]
MNVLFFGDIVGARANAYVAGRLPALRETLTVDLTIVNAENSAQNGLGMGAKQIDQLLQAGADVITGGNHSWDCAESVDLLGLEQVIRPANLESGVPGRGVISLSAGGEQVTVINLADFCAMKSVKATAGKFRYAYQSWSEIGKAGVVIVDYHGDHVMEKQIFAHAVDGEAAAVIGTHTHEPTGPLHILPGGTAFVADAGMIGPDGGMQGFDPAQLVAGLKRTGNPFSGQMPPVGTGPITGDALLMEISGGRTRSLRRVTL